MVTTGGTCPYGTTEKNCGMARVGAMLRRHILRAKPIQPWFPNVHECLQRFLKGQVHSQAVALTSVNSTFPYDVATAVSNLALPPAHTPRALPETLPLVRVGEALGLEVGKHISPDCRTLYIQQKAKRGLIQQRLKTKNGAREVDLCSTLAAMLQNFIGARTSGLLFQTSP